MYLDIYIVVKCFESIYWEDLYIKEITITSTRISTFSNTPLTRKLVVFIVESLPLLIYSPPFILACKCLYVSNNSINCTRCFYCITGLFTFET